MNTFKSTIAGLLLGASFSPLGIGQSNSIDFDDYPSGGLTFAAASRYQALGIVFSRDIPIYSVAPVEATWWVNMFRAGGGSLPNVLPLSATVDPRLAIDVYFVVPGTSQPATTDLVSALFADSEVGSTIGRFEAFDADGHLITTQSPITPQSRTSVLQISAPGISRVRFTDVADGVEIDNICFHTPVAIAQPTLALYLTNATILPDGCGQLEVIAPSNGTYTLQSSGDLRKWTTAMILEGPTNRFVVTSPVPMRSLGDMFLRVGIGRVPEYNLFHCFYDTAGTLVVGTPSVAFPRTIQLYKTVFSIYNVASFPEVGKVLFTGPPGSGLTQAKAEEASIRPAEHEAWYQSPAPLTPNVPPPGTWTVDYAGTKLSFEVPDPQADVRFIVAQPTVFVADGQLTHVSWVWRDATTGQALAAVPGYVTAVEFRVDGGSPYCAIYDSGNLDPNTASHTLPSPIPWSSIADIRVAFDDDLGHFYVLYYRK